MADSKQPRKPAAPSELDYAANGRDELNLAEFPISVLQWKQPKDKDGRKLDTIVYEATAYNPVARRVIPQRVTLTSPTKIGLPTPADEVVILALLCVAKHMHDFAEPRVHFSPHQLFRIIGWSPNPESYDRLATALMRYKALTILYENAWWDANPRQYKSRFMTGIIAEAKIEPTRGRLKDHT